MMWAALLAAIPPAPGVGRAAPLAPTVERCDYDVGGPTVASRTSTVQLIEFGEVRFSQDCLEAEARGPGPLNLTHLGVTELVAGEIASITVSIVSCTLAWPSRYAEIWLDWRGSGQFERLVDGMGGTYEPAMTSPFRFNFRVPADAAPGPTRLRVGTYTCQGCFRESTGWSRLNPCHQGEDGTAADLAVQILPPTATPTGVQREGGTTTTATSAKSRFG